MKRLGFILAALVFSLPAYAQSSTLFSNSSSVGIGTTSPATSLDLSNKTDALALPSGTSAQRPGTPVAGEIRYNQTTSGIEAYYASVWNAIPGVSNFRIRLSGNQTFYLSTTGSDSNNCLTSGTACATFNHVWNLISSNYDLAGYTATIQLADGTYTNGLSATTPAFGGPVVINGDSTTPANVIISTTSASDPIEAVGIGVTFTVQNLEMTTLADNDLAALNGSSISMGPGLIFGSVNSTSGSQINAQGGGSIFIGYAYSIVGGGAFHYYAADGSLIRCTTTATVTITGTPAFSQEFASSTETAKVIVAGLSYSGSATGTRYLAVTNAIIDTGTGNTSFLPGNAAGSTSTGGQYN